MRQTHRRASLRRRGYSLTLVIVFLFVLLSMLGLAYRQMATTLRLEEARTRQIDRDNATIPLASSGLQMLEGVMTTTSFSYTSVATTVDGPRSYLLNITQVSPPSGARTRCGRCRSTMPRPHSEDAPRLAARPFSVNKNNRSYVVI